MLTSMLIRLSATRLDLRDTFRFSIEADGQPCVVTTSALKAVKLLCRAGVRDPLRAVEHVQAWGAIEVSAAQPVAS